MNKQKILFIVNPKAGKGGQSKFNHLIERYIDKNLYDAECQFTQYAGHASEIAEQALRENFNIVVAVGGDGTVNEISKKISNTSTALGIIPIGSGNGLARDLGISTQPINAIKKINTGAIAAIDTCLINDTIPFFCTAGIGFDAHCAKVFSNSKRRGLLNYLRVSGQEYWKYKPLQCTFGGNAYQVFSMTFANARQYGNNAYIAPKAENDDGFIDCTILTPLPLYRAPQLVWQLFGANIHESPYAEVYRGTQFSVESDSNFTIHFDGEPLVLDTNKLVINILEKQLKVLI